MRIDDTIFREAKAEAAREGTTLTRFLEEALAFRLRMGRRDETPARLDLPVFDSGRRMPASFNLTAAIRAADAREDGKTMKELYSAHANIQALLRRGVRMPDPTAVYVDDAVRPERIAAGATIHPGCRLRGAALSIGPGCELGAEAPATVEDCQLGRGVALAGGFFAGSVFLDGVSFGSGGHVRPGTILEEQSSCAHNVGLKQTVLMPYVVCGSLINFCDALMAGGTSRKDHSEVGSSFVHFNYTPHRDKATASLLGDVPRGVMLDRPAIFLGGQGGLVGPVRIAYGTVLAAGTVWREDALEEGRLLAAPAPPRPRAAYQPGRYGDIGRAVANNFTYIGNLHALLRWYEHARRPFMTADPSAAACHAGATAAIRLMLDERVRRLDELAANMARSRPLAQTQPADERTARALARQQAFADRWPALRPALDPAATGETATEDRDRFLAALARRGASVSYLEAIHALPAADKAAGTRWLRSVVARVADTIQTVC